MPISWDSLLARHLARELDVTLRGARLRAVRFDARSRGVVLFFREATLLWRLHPEQSGVLLREAIEPSPDDPGLRARVRSVDATPDDRIMRFELSPERAGAGPGPWEFIVEVLGNQMNALVTEGSARTIRHVLHTKGGARPLRVGHVYAPPAPTARMGVHGDLSPEDWESCLAAAPPDRLAHHLIRSVAWVSTLNVDRFVSDETPPTPRPDAYEAWLRMANPATAAEPVVLDGSQPYPFPIPGRDSRSTDSLVAAFAVCVPREESTHDPTAAVMALGPEILERLEDAVGHAERRVVSLQEQMDRRPDADALRAVGDLILARYAEVPQGVSRTVLTGFTGDDVVVELDPTLPPHENANRYYDRAARSERAGERLPGLIDQAVARRDRLSALRDDALRGAATPDAIRSALPPAPARQRRGGQPASLPYRTYRSSGGLEIRVGRGARHNDDLTFRHSAPGDIWLHARHTAGAHVILRWQGEGSPPPRDLDEAGALAALNSSARTSSSVPVDWTRRKYVRKPRGSAAGAVLAERVKTVFVRPDPELADRLSTEE